MQQMHYMEVNSCQIQQTYLQREIPGKPEGAMITKSLKAIDPTHLKAYTQYTGTHAYALKQTFK